MENPTKLHLITPILGESADNSTLGQRVAEYLRMLILDGTLPTESQLPNELELSSLLKVSRSTVRSALTILEQGGFIHRRWGVGTFITKNPPAYDNLGINSSVTQLIRSSGAEPGTTETLITARQASEHAANRLSIEPGANVVVIERVRLASGRRVVFCVDILPQTLFYNQLGEIPLSEVERYIQENQSMIAFFRERLGIEIHHGIAWIRPITAEAYLAEKLSVPRDSNILHLEQVDYASNGDPLVLSDEYYVADAFTYYIYRTS